MTDTALEQHIAETVRLAVQTYFTNMDLEKTVDGLIKAEINRLVSIASRNAYDRIIATHNISQEIASWVNSAVSNQMVGAAKSALSEKARNMDIRALAQDLIRDKVEQSQAHCQFPTASISPGSIDWRNARISAASISGTHTDFTSTGITDISTSTQLTVTDQGLVVTNVMVDQHAFITDMTVEGHLIINGTMQFSDQAQQLINGLATTAAEQILSKKSDLDITDLSITAAGRLLLNQNSLGPGVVESNLRRVGNLQELSVMGDSNLADVLYVNQNGKVSINSPESSGAFTVWDENTQFSISKYGQKSVFAGSTRAIDLVLGSNGQAQMVMHTDGKVEIKGPVRFMGRLFSISDTVPEHQGEPGETVLVHNNIFVCQGANQWQKIT